MMIRRTALLAAVLALGCGESPGSLLTSPRECATTVGQQVLVTVNDARDRAGAGRLDVDLRLVRAAEAHSADMATADDLSHTGTDGSSAAERAAAEGYEPTGYLGEVVAAGFARPDAVVEAWLQSDGHRAILLAPPGDHLGVGHAVSGSGTAYWTVVVGTTASLEAPSGGCHP